MSSEPLTVGDAVRVLITVKDMNGSPVNPTTLAVTVRDPDGVESSAAVVNDSVGAYHFDLDLAKPGAYAYRAVATGAARAAGQGGIFVSPPIF